MSRRVFGAALYAALALSACRAEPQIPTETVSAEPATAAAVLEETPENTIAVTITTEASSHSFNAEVASTAAEQTRGLMFRESLSENGGMIFPFERPRIASFWMRNTIIPLDMIFIRADGRIANIARETEPYTLDSYRSIEPVIAVLEIDGGRSEELGIEDGDHVSWPDGPSLQE